MTRRGTAPGVRDDAGMVRRWRTLLSSEVTRVRREGRAAFFWSLRVTLAATASYVVATLLFPEGRPLLAPLTAMLVVQVTPISLLASGLDRVVAVVAGVGLAVGFSAVVPLEWWSLGLLILVSLVLGQSLRLRANLLEVAISAMLVLGVGALQTTSAAWQRITETLVGAAVGVLLNLLLPPRVPSADAGAAIDGLADSLSRLLGRAADELAEQDPDDRRGLRTRAQGWLDDARVINHGIPEVGAALLRAEESRRLNVRAVRTPHVEPGLRQGLEALEHSAIAVRSLMRAVADAFRDLPETERVAVLAGVQETFRRLAAAIDAFGELVRNEGAVRADQTRPDIERLAQAVDALEECREQLEESIAAGPGPDLLELYAVQRSAVRRVVAEVSLDARLRRQVGMVPRRRRLPRPARPPATRRAPADLPPDPDEETQVLPAVREPLADDAVHETRHPRAPGDGPAPPGQPSHG